MPVLDTGILCRGCQEDARITSAHDENERASLRHRSWAPAFAGVTPHEGRTLLAVVSAIFVIWMRGSSPCILKRDVVVLLPGVLQFLVAQHVEGAGDALAGRVRH